jgi:serine/threonine protein phosphatase PrpC
MEVYFKSVLGQRPTNEDKHTIILNEKKQNPSKRPINIYGIYDGHGGNHVSTILSNMIPNIFMDQRLKYPLRKSQVNKICDNIQKILIEHYSAKSKECGSTCLLVIKFDFEDKKYLNIVNVGDSRAIICSGTHAYALSIDHKPLNPVEKNRIMKQGGNIYYDGLEWRVDTLSVSRAFGDYSSKYTQPIPDLFLHKITKNDKFIILACDGLWDVVDNQTAVNMVLNFCYDPTGNRIQNKKINIAKQLTDYALSQGSSDNISVIVVFLQ